MSRRRRREWGCRCDACRAADVVMQELLLDARDTHPDTPVDELTHDVERCWHTAHGIPECDVAHPAIARALRVGRFH